MNKRLVKYVWACEQHIDMVPNGLYLSSFGRTNTVRDAYQFETKEEASNQCPQYFLPVRVKK